MTRDLAALALLRAVSLLRCSRFTAKGAARRTTQYGHDGLPLGVELDCFGSLPFGMVPDGLGSLPLSQRLNGLGSLLVG